MSPRSLSSVSSPSSGSQLSVCEVPSQSEVYPFRSSGSPHGLGGGVPSRSEVSPLSVCEVLSPGLRLLLPRSAGLLPSEEAVPYLRCAKSLVSTHPWSGVGCGRVGGGGNLISPRAASTCFPHSPPSHQLASARFSSLPLVTVWGAHAGRRQRVTAPAACAVTSVRWRRRR